MSLPLVLSMGDPASVSPLLTLRAWQRRETLPVFCVVGDEELYRQRAAYYDISVPIISIASPREAASCIPDGLPVICLPRPLPHVDAMGKPHPSQQEAVRCSIDMALDFVRGKQAAALITLPIDKQALHSTQWGAMGHTDYLARSLNCAGGEVMMLASDVLRVVTVTTHCSLRHAIDSLTTESIVNCVATVHRSLRDDFAIESPRLAMTGLNPHAGEDGLLGSEEIDIIEPALHQVQEAGIDCEGVFSADSFFRPSSLQKYDGIVCMYHDQALIPFKALSFDDGVNVTLGLPIVRCSPAHGTAFSLVREGKVSDASLCAAIGMGYRLAQSRGLA